MQEQYYNTLTYYLLHKCAFISFLQNFGEVRSIDLVTNSLPFSYQWLKNGTNLYDETNLIISLTDIRRADAGSDFN